MRDAPPPFCCHYIKSAFISTDEKGKGYLVQIKGLPCNLWSCPVCGPKKAMRLKYILIDIIKLNNLDHILTLTLKPDRIPEKYLHPIKKTGYFITYLFNRFRLTLQRKLKTKIKYVWVKEFQNNGNAHLHILVNRFLPERILRREWTRIGGGHSLDIQQVRNIEAAAVYITSYITKGFKDAPLSTGGFLVNERRHSTSRSCQLPPKQINSLIKISSVHELSEVLTFAQTMMVYNALQNPDVIDTTLLLAPHQETIPI